MKFEFSLKTKLLLNIFYCVFIFVNKQFIYISGAYISKSKQCYNAKPLAYYFFVKMKTLVDFHICISVPLMGIVEKLLSKFMPIITL